MSEEITDKHTDSPVFRIFCPQEIEANKDQYHSEENTPAVVEFFPEDKIAVCPDCKSKYIIKSIYIEEAYNHKVLKEEPFWEHSFIAETTSGEERLIHLETIDPLGIKPGTLVTLVQKGNQPIGIADHSRSLWFPIYEKPGNPIWQKYLQLIAGLLGVLAALQVVHFFDSYSGSALLLIFTTLLLLGVFFLPGALKLGEGSIKQSEEKRIKKHLPWLNRG